MVSLHKLWVHIPRFRRFQLGLLFLLMLLSSIAEIISIGTILPFLSALTNPNQALSISNSFLHEYFPRILFTPDNFVPTLTALFCLAAVFSGFIRILLLKVNTNLSYAIGADLSAKIYEVALYQPYLVHLSKNSSEVISGISSKTIVVISIVNATLTICSSFFIVLAILIALLYIQPIIALVAFCGFGVIYIGLIVLTRHTLESNGRSISLNSTRVVQSLQEGLGGIRDVLLDGNQRIYIDIYRRSDKLLRCAQASNQIIASSPRFVIEPLGMVLIAVLAFVMSKSDSGLLSAIPVIGALALGAQRLLPVFQQIYGSWAAIKGGQPSLMDTIELLKFQIPTENTRAYKAPSISFSREIHLRNISFSYNGMAPWVIKDLNLEIPCGSKLGIIGQTGGGKSTLLDLIMGLLEPNSGEVLVDSVLINKQNLREWHLYLAHVPQVIFLADASILENIALGVPKEKIDLQRIVRAAQQAQISSFIENLPNQYQTRVGERGVMLSGGQRQRLAIARALYKEAKVIIFDEATSALDGLTEKEVMSALDDLSKDLTVIIVAHRISTLQGCDRIVEIANGGVGRVGSYADFIVN